MPAMLDSTTLAAKEGGKRRDDSTATNTMQIKHTPFALHASWTGRRPLRRYLRGECCAVAHKGRGGRLKNKETWTGIYRRGLTDRRGLYYGVFWGGGGGGACQAALSRDVSQRGTSKTQDPPWVVKQKWVYMLEKNNTTYPNYVGTQRAGGGIQCNKEWISR
ncbi:hypothetical protein LX36DRAFT_346244 [Colletotrichum falcatum]|nr:hypothetical protein LX36DRAFT_346244 [Colletotrichum falcatum]